MQGIDVAGAVGRFPVAPGAARAIRVGGQTVSPGRARVVHLCPAGGTDPAEAIAVWVAAGARPGPRVTIIGAPRGFEIVAARVAAGLSAVVDPAVLNGGIVVVPVMRPGGRFAAHGRPVRAGASWRFPGDPGGNRRAREAFGLFSELAVGSTLLVVLTAPDPGRTAVLTVRGDWSDSRTRRLAAAAGTAVALDEKPRIGTLAAAAAQMGSAVLEICAPSETTGDDDLHSALRGLLDASGSLPSHHLAPSASRSVPAVTTLTLVRASIGGFLHDVISAGQIVPRGAVLARITPPLAGRAVEIRAPHDALVLEAGTRAGVRARAPLCFLGRVPHAWVKRPLEPIHNAASVGHGSVADLPRTGDHAHPQHVGWVESVSLPGLGVDRLRAKIDTGARTSALHVTRMTTVGTTDAPHRRSILELTLPGGSRRGARPIVVRVQVRDHVQVKDTSGRSERRPVIETTLRLGTLERKIRVTLTNRGDMVYPMLIGRTALGPGIVVDPTRRLLLTPRKGKSRN